MPGMLPICELKIYPSVFFCHSCQHRQVLIELGPSYFKYMESTANNPTVLAKLLGFYTIEIRNIESGTVQAKADLLVMENLFFDKKIVKTFDLKGIQGRKVKATTSGTSSKPLFDGDWIEGAIV
jgi:1-phosphatidylinositol-3-phosphate 5-kinase